jgi:large subunit ribosomal protein L17
VRHRKGNKHLGRTSAHAQSMVRNMVVCLFRHERIRTTVSKAKLMKPWAEKMITLGKDGTLHARRLAYAFLRSKPAVAKLFRTIGPRFKERAGGYTRIMKMAEALRPATSDRFDEGKFAAGYRLGDGTPLAVIELVEAEVTKREHHKHRKTVEPFQPRRELHKKSDGAPVAAGNAAESGAGEPPAAAGEAST